MEEETPHTPVSATSTIKIPRSISIKERSDLELFAFQTASKLKRVSKELQDKLIIAEKQEDLRAVLEQLREQNEQLEDRLQDSIRRRDELEATVQGLSEELRRAQHEAQAAQSSMLRRLSTRAEGSQTDADAVGEGCLNDGGLNDGGHGCGECLAATRDEQPVADEAPASIHGTDSVATADLGVGGDLNGAAAVAVELTTGLGTGDLQPEPFLPCEVPAIQGLRRQIQELQEELAALRGFGGGAPLPDQEQRESVFSAEEKPKDEGYAEAKERFALAEDKKETGVEGARGVGKNGSTPVKLGTGKSSAICEEPLLEKLVVIRIVVREEGGISNVESRSATEASLAQPAPVQSSRSDTAWGATKPQRENATRAETGERGNERKPALAPPSSGDNDVEVSPSTPFVAGAMRQGMIEAAASANSASAAGATGSTTTSRSNSTGIRAPRPSHQLALDNTRHGNEGVTSSDSYVRLCVTLAGDEGVEPPCRIRLECKSSSATRDIESLVKAKKKLIDGQRGDDPSGQPVPVPAAPFSKPSLAQDLVPPSRGAGEGLAMAGGEASAEEAARLSQDATLLQQREQLTEARRRLVQLVKRQKAEAAAAKERESRLTEQLAELQAQLDARPDLAAAESDTSKRYAAACQNLLACQRQLQDCRASLAGKDLELRQAVAAAATAVEAAKEEAAHQLRGIKTQLGAEEKAHLALAAELDERRAEVGKGEAAQKQLQAELESLQAELEAVRGELTAAQDDVASLKTLLRSAKELNQTLSNALEQDRASAPAAIEAAKRELEAAQQGTQKAAVEAAVAAVRLAAESEAAELRGALRGVEENLQEARRAAQQDAARLGDYRAKAQLLFKAKDVEVTRLRREAEAAAGALAEAEAAAAASAAFTASAATAAAEEVQRLERHAAEAEEDIRKLSEVVESLKHESEALRTRLQELEKRNRELSASSEEGVLLLEGGLQSQQNRECAEASPTEYLAAHTSSASPGVGGVNSAEEALPSPRRQASHELRSGGQLTYIVSSGRDAGPTDPSSRTDLGLSPTLRTLGSSRESPTRAVKADIGRPILAPSAGDDDDDVFGGGNLDGNHCFAPPPLDSDPNCASQTPFDALSSTAASGVIGGSPSPSCTATKAAAALQRDVELWGVLVHRLKMTFPDEVGLAEASGSYLVDTRVCPSSLSDSSSDLLEERLVKRLAQFFFEQGKRAAGAAEASLLSTDEGDALPSLRTSAMVLAVAVAWVIERLVKIEGQLAESQALVAARDAEVLNLAGRNLVLLEKLSGGMLGHDDSASPSSSSEAPHMLPGRAGRFAASSSSRRSSLDGAWFSNGGAVDDEDERYKSRRFVADDAQTATDILQCVIDAGNLDLSAAMAGERQEDDSANYVDGDGWIDPSRHDTSVHLSSSDTMSPLMMSSLIMSISDPPLMLPQLSSSASMTGPEIALGSPHREGLGNGEVATTLNGAVEPGKTSRPSAVAADAEGPAAAAAVALRAEVAHLGRQMAALAAEVADLQQEVALREEMECALKENLREMERASERQARVEPGRMEGEYLKNLVLQIFCSGELEALLPAAAALLSFSPDEARAAKDALQKRAAAATAAAAASNEKADFISSLFPLFSSSSMH